MLPREKLILVVLLVVNLLAFLPDLVGVFSASMVVDPVKIEPELDHAYRVFLREHEGVLLESRLNTISSVARSELILYENGSPLGPSHSYLRNIRSVGRGAYSHRGLILIFSSSDNTDPRENERVYRARFPLFFSTSVKVTLASLSVITVGAWLWWIGHDGRRRLLVWIESTKMRLQAHSGLRHLAPSVSVLAVVTGVLLVNDVMLTETRSLPCLYPDSSSYLMFSVGRTVGYPLFLSAILAVFGDVRWVVPVQLNLLLISIVLMGWAVGYLLRSRLAGLVTILSLFVAKPLLLTSCQLLSEGLFIPLLCLHIASVCLLLGTKSRGAAFLVGLSVSLVIAVRPAGYSLLVGLPVLLLFLRDQWRRVVGFLIGGVALVILGAVGLQYARSGVVATQSFGGLALIGHVAPIITEELDNDYTDLTERIARRIRPMVGELNQFPFAQRHREKSTQSYNAVLWENIFPEIMDYLQEREPALEQVDTFARANELAMAIAVSAIMDRPSWYAMHVLSHYLSLWNTFRHNYYGPLAFEISRCQRNSLELLQRRANTFIPPFDTAWFLEKDGAGPDVHTPTGAHWLDTLWQGMPYFTGVVVLVVFGVTALAVAGLYAIRLCEAQIQALGFLAVLLHSNLGFVAMVQPGIPRYARPLEPVLVVVVVTVVLLLARWGTKELMNRCATDSRSVRTMER